MKIRINTKDTYRIFYQLHGGEPVIHGNRLLFRDGWSYSRVGHDGPAYPPDDAGKLIKTYWKLRRKALIEEHAKLFHAYDSAKKLAESAQHDIALEVEILGEEQGARKTWAPISIDEIELKLSSLRAEIDECERVLNVSKK